MRFFLTTIFTFSLSLLIAQDSLDYGPVYLVSDTALLVIGRQEELANALPYASRAISRNAIELAQSLTTADALANLSGVYVQKSQFGGGSPVVRGFEANRVLLVVDGVRMNNAIYRSGHLQNAISIDPLALDRLEVIYGAGALAYGSDAIGGVIHFRTLRPEFRARSQDAMNGHISAASGSAAKSLSLNGSLSYGGANWGGLTLLSTTSTSHLRSGAQRPARYPDFGRRNEYLAGDQLVINDRPNVQIGTAYEQYNLLQKFRFRLKPQLELDANFQFSTTGEVPRYDALTERQGDSLRWAQWDYGPQTRTLASLRLQDLRPTALYDVATYLISHQFIAEDRFRRRAGDPLQENSLVDVHTANLQTDFSKNAGLLTFRYGLDARYDWVSSQAFLRDVARPGNRSFPLESRYPSGGSDLAGAGAYLDLERSLLNNWHIRGGFRYSYQRLRATFGADDPIAWPRRYLNGITNHNDAFTATLSLRRQARHHRWRFLYAQGFRAPNIDDFAKFRERNGRIQLPNPDLGPERSHTLEVGHVYRKGPFRVEANVYHTWLRRAIVRRDGRLPDGRNFFVSRGDTLLAQTNVNAESARVYGLDLALRWQLANAWDLATEAHALRGRRRQLAPDGEVLTLPQDHIPPPYGRSSLTYKKNALQLQLDLSYQLTKAFEDYAVNTITGSAVTGYTFDRTGTSDNLELTPFLAEENRFAGTYGWWTLNLRAEYAPTKRWKLRLKVDNVLDRHYRTFASGVSAAGVDVGLGIEYLFGSPAL